VLIASLELISLFQSVLGIPRMFHFSLVFEGSGSLDVRGFALQAGKQAPDQGSTVGVLLSVSPPEEHHEGTRFADVAAMQESVTAVLRSIPKEAFAGSFQKLYERCLQCVV
jgi:hypothetical protein